MKVFTWLRYLLISSINEDKLIFELKKENDRLTKENKELRIKIRSLKSNLIFKFYDNNLEGKIIEHLSTANDEVDIAVAWFTSNKLIAKLKELKLRGVMVNLIVTKAEINMNREVDLIKATNTFKIIDIPRGKTSKYDNIMHNKYCIIDNKKVIDGSYNWSYHARFNEEHIIVVESKLVANMYKDNFNRIINEPSYNIKSISMIS